MNADGRLDNGQYHVLTAVDALSPKDAWEVGFHYVAGHEPGTIKHWNGARWSVSPHPGADANIDMEAVDALSPKDVWAVGDRDLRQGGSRTIVEHWNGVSWSTVKSPSPGGWLNWFEGVHAISPTDVWAVGLYSVTRTSPRRPLIEHWDGRSWRVVSSPNPDRRSEAWLSAITAMGPDDVWAVGSAQVGQNSLIEHWNGTRWSIVSSPNPGETGNDLLAVTGSGADDIWTTGETQDPNGEPVIEHWNGVRWRSVSSPQIGIGTWFALWSASAVTSDDVWAVGDAGQFSTVIEHWNGAEWSVVPHPHPEGRNSVRLRCVSADSSTDAWAVGDYDVGSKTISFALHWDGTAWSVDESQARG